MRLELKCPKCQSIYDRLVARLKETSDNESTLNLTLNAVPEPKPVTIKKETAIGQRTLVQYSCGHSIFQTKVIPNISQVDPNPNAEGEESNDNPKYRNLSSLNGSKTAYDYQQEGVKFVQDSNYNCLIADEMGLGKTIQAVLATRECLDKLTPTILIVKSATIYQWIREWRTWGSENDMSIIPILTSKLPVIPGFQVYIVSMDLLPDVVDKLIALAPKLVIADEVQGYKNPQSKRSKALVRLVQEAQVQHKIFLSGTPIKNRASEYFTILNLLSPGHFPSYRHFNARWLEPVGKGSLNRIRPYAIEDFRRLTSRWILRREVIDVQKDLPPLRYGIQEIEITDPLIKARYNKNLDLFSNWLNDPSQKKDPIGFLGWLTKLRHETALAKMGECIELTKDFLDSTEDQKIAIGIHHKDVRDSLFYALEPYGCIKLSGEDSAQAKDWAVQKFRLPQTRVGVINQVSGGTGLDGLQVCNNVFILERQWSPADEEQFVKRFNRDGQTKPVLVTYLMAHGTIDTFFHELNEQKKEILKGAYGNWDLMTDTGSLKELSLRVIENRL